MLLNIFFIIIKICIIFYFYRFFLINGLLFMVMSLCLRRVIWENFSYVRQFVDWRDIFGFQFRVGDIFKYIWIGSLYLGLIEFIYIKIYIVVEIIRILQVLDFLRELLDIFLIFRCDFDVFFNFKWKQGVCYFWKFCLGFFYCGCFFRLYCRDEKIEILFCFFSRFFGVCFWKEKFINNVLKYQKIFLSDIILWFQIFMSFQGLFIQFVYFRVQRNKIQLVEKLELRFVRFLRFIYLFQENF